MRRREFLLATSSLLTTSLITPFALAQGMSLSTAINRTARCRMLSQRATKAYGLVSLKVATDASRAVLAQCIKDLRETLAEVEIYSRGRAFANAKNEFSVQVRPFITELSEAPNKTKLAALAEASDKVLESANGMVVALESAANSPTARIVNTAGRQRMLTQRIARHYVLTEAKLDGGTAAAAITRDRTLFLESQNQLAAAPITSPAIKASLDKSSQLFTAYTATVGQAGNLEALATQSETIVAELDVLTRLFEQAVQAVIG
jgi:Type IV pili methyl-accepting chemotaxis transducer N-term